MSDGPKTEAEEREYQERLREMNEALLVSSVRQHELTEQAQRAEAALRESEEKYRSLFESIDEGYCIIEVLFDENEHPVDYRFLDVCPSFEKQTGIENAVGRRMREIAPQHEEHWFEIYGRIAQTGEAVRFENRAEELHRWYDVYAFRYGQPESRQVAILFNDITKRKLAEAELGKWEYIFNHAGWAVVVANPDDNTLVLVNPAFARMHGYTVEELTGQPLAMTYAPEVRAELPKHVAAAHEQGDYIYELPHVRKDGTTFPVLTHVTTFKDERGRILYRSATLQDITERKRTEEALREPEEKLRRHAEELEQRVAERTAELSETNEALQKESSVRQRAEAARTMLLRRFVSVQEDERHRLSRELHDQFGQQLAALNINLGLLKEDCSEQEGVNERIDVISSIVKQLDADVDFLAWELRPTALDDLGLIAVLDSYIKEWSKHNNVPVDFHRDETDDRLAPEIEITLYRIAQEALSNVSKHAQAKTVSIILEWRESTLSLIVEDDGRGFDTSEPDATDGKKLGLTGMRERAALLGGTVDIESHVGSGTAVFVRIPMASDAGGGQTAYH